MDLESLIAALSRPEAYPVPTATVEVHQTHISAVFLTDEHAYKIKKPVDLGFLDFRTLDRRKSDCEREVRLNRRLAPCVYLGVVPIARTAAGDLAVEGRGEVVEWAVKMVRLPEEATLLARLRREELDAETLERLARRIAAFHAAAESGPRIAAFGRFEVVERNVRENLEQSTPVIGTTISPVVRARLEARTEESLAALRPVIEARAARGVPRDTHGDLRLEHVYLFPDRPEPGDVVVVDGIEFNERFRYADPVADAAFLAMDLAVRGRRDLAGAFAWAYIAASGDAEGGPLWPFYTAYRSAVRAKVAGLALGEREIPESDRAAALQRARAHWLLALVELEQLGSRPGLVLVGGLRGAGKSTLARALAGRSGFRVIHGDRAPGELVELDEPERSYAACLARAEALLFEGARVLVEAPFEAEAHRRAFLDCAGRWGVPAVFLHCRAEPATIRVRLGRRRDEDPDVDRSIDQRAPRLWEPPGARTRLITRVIPTDASFDAALARALAALREFGLET